MERATIVLLYLGRENRRKVYLFKLNVRTYVMMYLHKYKKLETNGEIIAWGLDRAKPLSIKSASYVIPLHQNCTVRPPICDF
jgi:hypothetical protein